MYEFPRCPRCERPVRLPDFDSALWVRCPHCSADFPLASLDLALLPPRLESVPPPSIVGEAKRGTTPALLSGPPSGGAVTGPGFDSHDESTARVRVRSPETLSADRRKPAKRRSRVGRTLAGGFVALFMSLAALGYLPFRLGGKVVRAGSAGGSATELATPAPVEIDSSTELRQLVLGMAAEPSLPVEDLEHSLGAVRDAIAKGKQNGATFNGQESFEELAYRLTFTEAAAPAVQRCMNEAKKILKQLADDDRTHRMCGLEVTPQHRKGTLVSGTVTSVSNAGRYTATTVELPGAAGRKIDVLCPKSDTKERACQSGDRILSLGVVVTNPQLYLLGYRGDSDHVILSAVCVTGQQ